jgi:GTP-binding protein HflX
VEKKVRKELEAKVRTRAMLNAQRHEKRLPLVSLFGYTNAGKTSLTKALTGDTKLRPVNRLFATLDVTYHGAGFTGDGSSGNSSSNTRLIFADTIGFISDIPTGLVEAFRTSVADTLVAQVYVHVVDVSHPDRVAQERTVLRILAELAPDRAAHQRQLATIFTVYNKCDKLSGGVERTGLELELQQTGRERVFFVSSRTGEGVAELRAAIEAEMMKVMRYVPLRLRIEQGSGEWAFLNKHAVIKSAVEDAVDAQFLTVEVLIDKPAAIKFVNLFPRVEISK